MNRDKNFKKAVFILSIIFVCLILILRINVVEGHPGRTDSSGCHYCRTNCESYGLSYGEYHCHNGGSSSSSNSTSTNNDYNYQLYLQQQQQQQLEQQQREQQQAAYNEEQRRLGKEDGYNFKIKNPNDALPDMSGKNELYIEEFKSAFEQAENEIKEKTINSANEKASKDALVLLEMDLTVPEGLNSSLYKSIYKSKFDEIEENLYSEARIEAQENAKADVYNYNNANAIKDNVTTKKQEAYTKYYNEAYLEYKNYLREKKKELKTFGYQDGMNFEEKSDENYKEFKDFEVYDKLEKIYLKAYDSGYNEKMRSLLVKVISIVGILSIIIVFGVLFYKTKNRKNSFKH